jgi:RNA polymerase sigma-70 factor (ECF subfamily)
MAAIIVKEATKPGPRRKAAQSTGGNSPYPAPSDVAGGEWNFTSFEDWVRGCEDKAFRFAMHFLRDEPAVQEILQGTFLAAWENIQAFANRTRFNAWVYRTTVKAALERLSATRSRGRVSHDHTLLFLFTTPEFWSRVTADEDTDWSVRPPDQLASDGLLRHIRRTVDALPLELRAVFVVCGVEEMSLAEGADILDLPVRTVRVQLEAATLAVRHAIGRYFALGVGRVSRRVAGVGSGSDARN